ncbi:MAG: lysophospholipid acyltransferase family protein [Bdellovibrionia bacterium]
MYYLRSFFSTLFYPFFTLMMSITEIILNLIFNNRRIDDFMVFLWGYLSCALFGVKVQVKGLENYPSRGCIVIFNHASFFDIFALAMVLPGIRFGAKEELFKIPFFGAVMRRVGMLEIARERREEVFKVYQKALERFKRGERFALAPEGTRQIEEKLGNFKSGPFIFAINGQVELVPVVIRGAAKILPKGHFFPNWGVPSSTIEVLVLPPVSTQGLSKEHKSDLMSKTWGEMDFVLRTGNLNS